jgi:hypothetical protein
MRPPDCFRPPRADQDAPSSRASTPPLTAALSRVQAALGLDFGGIDFGLAPDGSLLLFEANAAMAVIPPDPDPIWNYRRPAVAAAIGAARRMLTRRAERGPAA